MLRRTLVCALLLAVPFAGPAYPQEQSASPATSPATQANQPASAAPAQRPMRIRVGGDAQAKNLVRMVHPVYPPHAMDQNITGNVVFHVIIAVDGSVRKVDYVSGPVELKLAAMDAVKEWGYKTTLPNGEPVEVDTTVKVVFAL